MYFIPKLIHKVYIETSMTIPVVLPDCIREAHESWIEKNPGYKVKYYSGNDCRKYLKLHFGKKHLNVFDNITAFGCKCDFFRFCVMYNEGGVYSDWKQVCIQPIDSYMTEKYDFVAFKDLGNEYSITNDFVQNAFFCSVKGHPILKKAIQICMHNFETQYYGNSSIDSFSIKPFSDAIASKRTKATQILGYYKHDELLSYFYLDNQHVPIILHKAIGSGYDQNWKHGNNYDTIWKNKTLYKNPKKKKFYTKTLLLFFSFFLLLFLFFF